MTAAELARELEVSERTVTRDVLALSEAGVPVYADRGRAGGYRLIGGYRTRLTGLGRSEAEALFLSGVPGRAAGDGARGRRVRGPAEGVRRAAALAAGRRPIGRPSASISTPPAGTRSRETPELLPAVAEAVWDDRRITARYRRKDTEVERELEPYGLVLKAGVWYLCARVRTGDFRVYRIDRFTAVDAERRTLRPRRGLRPARLLGGAGRRSSPARSSATRSCCGSPRRAPAGCRTSPTARRPARRWRGRAGPDEQGRVTVTLPVESADVAYAQLLALGPEVEILEPPELRARFADGRAAPDGAASTG